MHFTLLCTGQTCYQDIWRKHSRQRPWATCHK